MLSLDSWALVHVEVVLRLVSGSEGELHEEQGEGGGE